MQLESLDWALIVGYFAVTLVIGLVVARRAGKDTTEFFLSGRSMPWWLLGVSMVATTFSTDTPNLVTDIVRQHGVSGNWVWWAFLLTGMLTVFVYARLWRRSGVTTDIEFYELRYSGKAAAFLRGFRAVYLGVFFNICIMATVTLAAIKIGGVMFNLKPWQTIVVASVVTVIFSAAGGLRAVLLTDFLLFFLAMAGSITAAVVALGLPEVGGLTAMLSHEAVVGKLSILPAIQNPDGSSNMNTFVGILVIPLAVQWWSVWYPGSEPGGGGYVAQRMLSARNERHAVAATFFFQAAHYALRPWPWILVALASLIVFPDVASIAARFPHVPADKLGHDLAYPAMLTFLPAGLLGLVVASLIAAYMSTISSHLNWGSSYMVNDVWRRFLSPGASQRQLVWVGRISTVLLMALAGTLAMWLESALQAFEILLQIGAGTGLLFILRWFWWRINPYSELTAMVVSFAVAAYMQSLEPETLHSWQKLLISVGITTVAWVAVTLLTPSDDPATLRRFYKLVRPGGPGWQVVIEAARRDGVILDDGDVAGSSLPRGILSMALGVLAVYATLFRTGYWLYGQTGIAITLTLVAVTAGYALLRVHGTRRSTESP